MENTVTKYTPIFESLAREISHNNKKIFDQYTEELLANVRKEIYNTVYANCTDYVDYTQEYNQWSKCKSYKMKEFITKMKESLEIEKDEKVILYTNAIVYREGMTNIYGLVLTNMSNIVYAHVWRDSDGYMDPTNGNYRRTKHNIPIAPVLIRIIQSTSIRSMHGHSPKLVRSFLEDILEINKEYRHVFLSTAEIGQLYSKSLDDIKQKDKELLEAAHNIQKMKDQLVDIKSKHDEALSVIEKQNTEALDIIEKKNAEVAQLKAQIEDMRTQLSELIPIENQCVICSRYTKKTNALVPCGHTQYCLRCIGSIKECSICRVVTTQHITIFN